MALEDHWDRMLRLTGSPGRLEDQNDRALRSILAGSRPGILDMGSYSQPVGPSPADSFQTIFDQLQNQLHGIQVAPTPLDILKRQASATVGAQYDPQIEALKREMGSTEKRAKKNQKSVKGMYKALGSDIDSQMAAIGHQFDQAESEANSRYADAKNALQGSYNEQAANQDAVLRRLGIAAAEPDANQQMNADQAYFQQQQSSDKRQLLDALAQMEGADKSYNRQSADNAVLAGTNRAADIGTQLEDYLQQAGGQLTGLMSGKESAVAAMLAQLQQSDAQNVHQQEQDAFNRIMALNRFQLDIAKQQAANQPQAPESLFKGTTGLSGMTNYLAELYPDNTGRATDISSLVEEVLRDPTVVSGKQRIPGAYNGQDALVDMTPEYIMNLIRKRGLKDHMSGSDINNAMNAYLAYAGKLR